MSTRESDSLSSAGKALTLLETFARAEAPMGVSELARRANLPKSTAFRLLSVLETRGFVERTGTLYQLSWRTFRLGERVLNAHAGGALAGAGPVLHDLHVTTGYAVQLNTLDGSQTIEVERVAGVRAARGISSWTNRHPANCVASGKAILAFGHDKDRESFLRGELPSRTRLSITQPAALARQLRRVQVDGVAFDQDESVPGLGSIAVPILQGGIAVAAVSLVLPSHLLGSRGLVSELSKAAGQISTLT